MLQEAITKAGRTNTVCLWVVFSSVHSEKHDYSIVNGLLQVTFTPNDEIDI